MRKLVLILLLSRAGSPGLAQQWLAPEACWARFADGLGQYYDQFSYHNDTIIDGLPAQEVHWILYQVQPGPDTSVIHLSDVWGYKLYYAMQGDAVLLQRYPFPTGWDTLFYLGEIGDRWFLPGADESCAPYGMIQIEDTAHVIVDGVALRAWDLAILDEAGQPLPENTFMWNGDTLAMIERLGWIHSFHLGECVPDTTVIIDNAPYDLVSYSDIDLTIPGPFSCSDPVVMGLPAPSSSRLSVHPNPGTNELRITGHSASAYIQVRDPLGRLVHDQNTVLSTAIVETRDWPRGTYFVIVSEGMRAPQVLKWIKQ